MPKPSPVLKLKPVSIWNRDVGVDFGGFFANLGEALFSVSAGNLVSAFKSLFDASRAVELKELKPDEAAAVLVGRAIQRAMVRLLKDSEGSLQPGVDPRQALKDFQLDLADMDLEIDQDFLRNPPRFELLKSLEDALQEWLVCSGARAEEAASTAQRLHPFFLEEFHEEWACRRNTYRPMEDYFELPSSEAAGRERAWDRYRAKLQKQIDESVLGQPFSLRQTFVPLRAYWIETVKEDDEDGRTSRESEKIQHVVELGDELERWVEDAKPEDAIRMISGGPGSGKSSAAKTFAAAMSVRNDLRAVWVPLHHFSFDTKLEKALAELCDSPGMPPVDFLKSSDRVLLIFDGLDELAMAGRGAQEAAKAFVSELIRLVGSQNRDSLKVQALLSGREVAISEYAAELRRSRTLFLLGHYPDPELADRFASGELYGEDRRDEWWLRYQAATGLGPGALPENLQGKRLRDLTSQPLLTVLLALVDHESLDLTTPWALNDLYETLLGHVYERKWGGPHQHRSHRVLSKEKYLRVLEEIAVGVWHSGEARQISRGQILERCKKVRLEEELEKFSEDGPKGVTQLLTAFYFRRSEGLTGDEMTFEFTHKSFAEYLVARRISAVIDACHDDARAYEADPDRGKSTRDLLVTWAKLLGPEILEDNLADLMRGEILKQPEKRIADWHGTLQAMLQESAHRSLPMEKVGIAGFAEMRRQSRHAELALAVACAAAAEGSNRLTDFQWKDRDQPADWIHWLSFGHTETALLTRKGLQRGVWSGANLRGATGVCQGSCRLLRLRCNR